jgi:hypothetical protein
LVPGGTIVKEAAYYDGKDSAQISTKRRKIQLGGTHIARKSRFPRYLVNFLGSFFRAGYLES